MKLVAAETPTEEETDDGIDRARRPGCNSFHVKIVDKEYAYFLTVL